MEPAAERGAAQSRPGRTAELRLIECWLPLAQDVSEAQGWGEGARALERLIAAAAPALATAVDTPSARAILVLYHTLLHDTQL